MRGAPGMGFVPLQVEEGTRNLSLLGHVRTHTPTNPEARSHQTRDLPASSPQTPSLGAMRHKYLFFKPPVCGILLQQSPSRFRQSGTFLYHRVWREVGKMVVQFLSLSRSSEVFTHFPGLMVCDGYPSCSPRPLLHVCSSLAVIPRSVTCSIAFIHQSYP